MNFISRMESQEIQVELKYCERCGGLWLRPQGADGVHCGSCRLRLAAMPDPGVAPPRTGKRRARVPGVSRETVRTATRIDSLQGVAPMEVRV